MTTNNRLGTARVIVLPAGTSYCHAFTGATQGAAALATGNPCAVTVLRDAPTAQPDTLDMTRCLTWPTGPFRAGVRCWNAAGRAIACCGHGLLSCADHWLDDWDRGGSLEMGGTLLPCTRREGLNWLGFPSLSVNTCESPAWLADVLGAGVLQRASLHCALAGGDQGYLVVDLGRDADLAALKTPDETLARHTGRALVVTCAVSLEHALCGEDIQFRYFAPQYGEPEDSATGSAMRVLASYWQDHSDSLVALQRSATGGYLRSRIADGLTWVGGQVVAGADP